MTKKQKIFDETKKMKEKDFIEFFKIHGSKYDYSKAYYYNSHSQLSVICKDHGIFQIRADIHLSGKGCPQCSYARREKYRDKSMNQKDFIEASFKVHGKKYDYTKVEYLNLKSKVSLICKEHGNFYIRAEEFLKGIGCPFCARLTQLAELFLKEMQEKDDHSDLMFSVSELEPESEGKTINPFEIEIKNDGANYSLYRDDKPIKISKNLFNLKKEILITHNSGELLEHIISELDGQGELKFDEKGQIAGPKIFFSSIALYSLHKDLIEFEQEELSNQLEELIFSDPLLLPYTIQHISSQHARYTPLERWLGKSLDELFILANSMIEHPCWEDDKKIPKHILSAECVLRVRDEYKSLSLEERTVVSYLKNNHDNSILFPIALVKGHCSLAQYARGIMASRSLFKSLNESITTDQQRKFFADLCSDASKAIEYIRLYRKGTPNKFIKDLIEKGESKEQEFKSTLRWDLGKDKKGDYITNACMKTIAALMNTIGGKLLIGISDDGDYVGIEKDRFKTDDKFLLFLTNSIKDSLGIKVLEFLNINIYELGQYKICLVDCEKADELIYCKKKGEENEHVYIRTGPETIILQPSEFEEYKKRNFDR